MEHMCRHNNGCLFNATCKAGVNYRQLVGGEDLGWVMRIPCNTKNKTGIECEKLELPSGEELVELERDYSRFIEMIKLADPIAVEMKVKYAEEGGQEVVECPVCKGRLYVSVSSYNGHCHGSCETDGCLHWRE